MEFKVNPGLESVKNPQKLKLQNQKKMVGAT